ncbi:GAF and ANTAR domain-containing protein [Pseudarthrobacter sp. NS4]|uniref:GAF and ANTAR domain-containing protein n=1 Tax=Pseudarthrobacter sp. NS4 TaxID=2973976 RepID=UPI0021624983|nr:GAF and ANTAR domain-containing protein [Pseudarthrobacter sp. NS4]
MAGKNPSNDQLQDLLLESKGLPNFLLRLTLTSVSLLGGPTPLACSLSVQRGSVPEVVASSSAQAKRLDLLQHGLEEGPCLAVIRGQDQVFVPDLHSDGRWRRFASAASGERIRSVLAIRIGPYDSVKGVLSCYSSSQHTLEPTIIDAVKELAVSMSRAVQLALNTHSRERASEEWHAALQSRAVVDGAVALIMIQDRCSRAEALMYLHQGARTTGRPLLEEAGKIIHGKFLSAT